MVCGNFLVLVVAFQDGNELFLRLEVIVKFLFSLEELLYRVLDGFSVLLFLLWFG